MNSLTTRNLITGIGGAIVAAVLFSLACPPFGMAAAAWLVPGLLLVTSRKLPIAPAFAVGSVYGILSGVLVASWLPQAMRGGLEMSLPLVFASVGLPYAVMAAGYSFASRRVSRVDLPIVGTFLWLASEWLRAQVLGWELLGHTQFRETLLIQIADLGGVYAVSFVVAFASISLFETVTALGARAMLVGTAARQLALPAATVAVALIYGVGASELFGSVPISASTSAVESPSMRPATLHETPSWSVRPASTRAAATVPQLGIRQVSKIDAKGMNVSPLLCEDLLDTELVHSMVRQGADVLINNCRVPWMGTAEESAAAEQHLAVAVFRSVESRRFIVRSTNANTGELITALGKTYSAPPRSEALNISHENTRYMRSGDNWILFGFGLSMVVVGRGRRNDSA